MKNRNGIANYESLDDIGFVGDQSAEFTEEDRTFLRKFFADRKTAYVGEQSVPIKVGLSNVAYA